MSADAQQVQKLEAVKRALAIANRVNSSALEAAKKVKKASISGGAKKRSSSPSAKKPARKSTRKSSPKRARKSSPKKH